MLLRALLIGMAVSFSVQAQDKKEEKKKAPTAQQQRMAECNKKTTGMKGDERKKFMSECLKS